MRITVRVFQCLTLMWLVACGSRESGTGDLVITNAALFDVHTGAVEPDCTIMIKDGEIARVLVGDVEPSVSGADLVDAAGRLVTPGFFDVHHHVASILSDSISATGGFSVDLDMDPDSIAAYRGVFADEYLPFGVTTVRGAGGNEADLPLMQAWMKRAPEYPDFYAAGGAIVSHEEGRTPYEGHVVVHDPEDAAAKVQEYYDAGLRHIKLYWRLRQPEFDGALERAQALNMNVYGHIDYKVLSIEYALSKGLKNFEHAITLLVEVLTPEELGQVWNGAAMQSMREKQAGLYFFYIMELCNFVGKDNERLIALIDDLESKGATVTPTLHIFAQRLGLSYFTSEASGNFEDTSAWSREEMTRARAGYEVLADCVKRLFDEGVQLNLGTDSSEPGKAVLSEMLLLHDLGIPMADVLTIATLNSAKAIGMERLYGSIEVGKRANLVLFEANPLEDPRNLLSGKTVIKDGVVSEP